MITLTLPYPISANRLWRTRVVGKIAMTYLSPEGAPLRSTSSNGSPVNASASNPSQRAEHM